MMGMHIETLFVLDERGRMVAVNEPERPPAPRIYLGRMHGRNIWRFRADLPDDLVARLEEIVAGEPVTGDLSAPFVTRDALRHVLEEYAPVMNVWNGPAWVCPEDIAVPDGVEVVKDPPDPVLERWFPYTAGSVHGLAPVVAVVVDNHAVAVCRSARTSEHAAEAGVDTVAEYRGRGFASAVVAGWATEVRKLGRVPLYSTSWDNVASQGVARRLGLQLYGVDLHFS